jgi:hypothetical protein
MTYKPYVPKTLSELWDWLGHMMLASPTFKDKTGFLRHENIDTTFFSLNEGLLIVRKKLGEENYAELSAMSDKMRTLFESDPDNSTGATRAGRKIIREMEDILRNVGKRQVPK